MIPLKLTLSGIYSFRENKQIIDFRRLTQEALFGIFGKVGSGKSTVLEAIIFALYSKSERMGGHDYLYNMMNLSSNELYIDFEFEAGEVEYRSIVKMKRNSRNFERINPSRRELYKKENGEWVALDTKDDANKIDNIIGLDYDNFRKVIIIPQGAFKDFLEMTAGERTNMFSKIFPELKQYDLYNKADALLSETKEKRTFIMGQLEQLATVSKEMMDEESVRLEKLNKDLEENRIQLENCKQRVAQMDKLKGLVDKYNTCVAELQRLENDKVAITKLTEQLREYNDCVRIFGEDIKQRNNTVKRRDEIVKELEKVEAVYLVHKKQAEEILAEYENCQKEYNNLDAYRRERDDLQKLLEVRTLEGEIAILQTEQEKLTNIIKDIEQETDRLNKEKNCLEKDYNALKKTTLPAEQLMQLHEWYTMYHKLLEKLSENDKVREKILSADNELNNQLNSLVEGRTYLQGCSHNLVEVREYIVKEIDRIESKIKSTNEKLNTLRVKQELYHYSTALHDGEPCPLCGSVHHPNITTGSVEDEIKKLKVMADSLEKEKDNLYRNALTWVDRNSQAQNDRKAELTEADTKRKELNNAITAHIETFVWAGFAYNDNDYKARIDKENAKIKRLNKLLDDIRVKETEIMQSGKKRDEYNTNLQQTINIVLPKQTLLQQSKNDIDQALWQQSETMSNDMISTMLEGKKSVIKKIEESYAELTDKKEKINATLNQSEGQKITLEKQKTTVMVEMEQINAELGRKVKGSIYESLEYVEAVVKKNLDANRIQESIDAFKSNYNTIVAQKDELQKEIAGESYNSQTHTDCKNELAVAEQKNQNILKEQAVVAQNIENIKENLARKQQLETDDKQLEEREANLKTLAGMFKGGGFMKYVSGMYLENLVNNANVRFKEMTSQQLAIITNEKEELDVRDNLNQGRVRAIDTLSGGQKFQASLALALALVDSVQCFANNTKKFFFLDEGFGTQDKDSLEIIFNTLKSLGKENRIVGIISHVEELKQNIPTYITMKNYAEKGSIIERY